MIEEILLRSPQSSIFAIIWGRGSKETVEVLEE